MSQRIIILALPGSWGSSLMGVVDIFSISNAIASHVTKEKGQLFEPLVVSMDGQPVHCSSGQLISADGCAADIGSDDIVYMPAITMATRPQIEKALEEQVELIEWLAKKVPDFSLFITHCSGAFFLAEAGLVDDMTMTTAWFLANIFKRRYPEIQLDSEAICAESGNIMCGGATSSYQDLCLRIIERTADRHFARLVAKFLMIDNQRTSQTPYSLLADYEIDDPVVNQSEQWIRKHLEQDIRVKDIADAVAVSPRTLIRRFKNSLDESPQSFIQKLRLEKSKFLLETTRLPWSEIVERCGYRDDSSFRRLFKRHCGVSPGDYRQRFNPSDKSLVH